MSDEQNLTFVGGKAIEQHESLDSNVEPDVREDAKEAVRKAIQEAADEAKATTKKVEESDGFKPPGLKRDDDEGIKRGPDGKFQKGTTPPVKLKAETEEEEDVDLKKGSVKQILKNRERVSAKLKEAQEQASGFESERRKLAEEMHKVQETYRQLQEWQAEVQRERAKFDRLRKDPAYAIRDIGWEPEQFITDLARDGTPEGQMARQQRQLQEQLEEIRNWKEQQAQQAEEARQRAAYAQHEQYRQHIEKSFIDTAMSEEKYPHISAFYKGRERQLIAAGDLTAYEFRELAGREGGLDEILDFIEDDLADRANAWYSKKSGTNKGSVPSGQPGKGSKGKSLTPEAASERRSLGRESLKDLDEEERKAAARQAVAAALEDDDE